LTKLKRLGVDIIGAPLDDDGLKIDALARILEDLGRKGIRPKYVYTIRRSKTRPARSCRASAAKTARSDPKARVPVFETSATPT